MKQYKALFDSEGVEVNFTDEAVREIAHIAALVNADVENIGARRLHTILTTLLEEILFELPDGRTLAEIGEQKQALSHRALAIHAMIEVLKGLA